MTDYIAAELETDRIVDAQRPITQMQAKARTAILCECGSTMFRATDTLFLCFLCDMYEDELPKDLSDGDYAEWFERSWVDGVRMGPRLVRVESNEPKPLTQAEIMATIHRVADQMDQWQNELLGQSRPDSD